MTGSFYPMLFGVVCMLSIALVCILLVNKSGKRLREGEISAKAQENA